jgi:hypothetical protein
MNPTSTTKIKIDPYSSVTGQGTLSYYANKYGTNVDNLMKLNPNITNKNMIFAGQDLTIPTFQQPSVVTSETANKAYNNAVTNLNNANNIIPKQSSVNVVSYKDNPDGTTTNTLSDGTTSTVRYNKNPDGSLTPTEVNNQNSLKPINTSDNQNTTTNNSGISAEIENANISLKNQTAKAQEILDSTKAGLDENTQAMIDSINSRFDKMVTEQTDINNRYLASARVSGIRSGIDRYASDLNDNILSRETADGIKRISDLETQRQDLIRQAESARTEKQRAAVIDYENQINQINAQKANAVAELFKQQNELINASLTQSREQRQSISDNIKNSIDIAKGKGTGVYQTIEDLGLKGQDKEDYIRQVAKENGIDFDYLNNAVAEAGKETASGEIGQYQQALKFGYISPIMTLNEFRQMGKSLSTKMSQVFTYSDAKKYGLPEPLVGKSYSSVIEDVNLAKAPDWFLQSQQSAGHYKPKDSSVDPATGLAFNDIQAQWNMFRGSNDIKFLSQRIDLLKTSSSDMNYSGSSDDRLY